MKGKSFAVFLAVLASSTVQVSSNTYVGAVVEFNPVRASKEAEAVALNVLEFEKFMAQAHAKGADIIVFPENGLGIRNLSSIIPHPLERVLLADNSTFPVAQFVRDLSAASKKHRIYSVVNLVEMRQCEEGDESCPPKGYYIFNTNVVFDRDGMVVGRYAKFNLFDEDGIDKPPNVEMSFFDTDFGVRFGTFTCFDILFGAPAQLLIKQFGITDFVFTTHWFSEMPFLTALQMQRGWAETNDVNLLASGLNNPSTGSGGSGIYNGRFGALVEVIPETITRKLLVATVPKVNTGALRRSRRAVENVLTSSPAPPAVSQMKLLSDQFFLFSSVVIPTGKDFDEFVCSHNNFCCSFKGNVIELKRDARNYKYRAMVYNGPRMYGKTYRGGVQVCGVVLCNGPWIQNCNARQKDVSGLFKFKELQIRGRNFRATNSFQMPSTLTDGHKLHPLPANRYSFRQKEEEDMAEVSLHLVWPSNDLHTFAIYGRDYTQDGGELPTGTGASLKPFLVFLFIFSMFNLTTIALNI